ncbi:MAG: vitamin K epoxide reductase family protein [Gemmatimonadaceae bacterium]
MTIAVLSLLGLFVALYLTLYKVGVIGELTCSIGSCEKVQTSKWAMFSGVPVAAWGVAAYAAMLTLSIAGLRERWEGSRALSYALLALAAASLLFSAWLTYLELFVIDAICMWCVISALLIACIFVAGVVDVSVVRRQTSEV